MPDANGWPTAADCIRKLDVVLTDDATARLLREVEEILAGVIVDFQSPVGRDGRGGTGRTFTPVTETRVYDGSGLSILHVDDIVPGTSLTVTSFGTMLTDIILSNEYEKMGHSVLVRRTVQGNVIPPAFGGRPLTFARGRQNISVTATFGYAATVPGDIYECVRKKVVYDALVTGIVGLNGVGEEIEIDGFKVSTSVGAINWRISSPIGVFHDDYEACKSKYRIQVQRSSGHRQRRMF